MDVSLWKTRFLFCLFLLFSLVSCGNRFDLSTERGRQARIDDANFYLSQGLCQSAIDTISPLYASSYADEEVRLIMASAYACQGGFNLLTIAGNLESISNVFSTIAKSMTNVNADGKLSAMYKAVDVLLESGAKMNAVQRSTSVNNYMAFIQLGVVGAILRNYGDPASDGSQGTDLVYETAGANPAGEMSNEDACALSAALAIFTDSFGNSSLTDANIGSVNTSLNGICGGTCASANKDRSTCDGTNADSTTAEAIVSGVNAAW